MNQIITMVFGTVPSFRDLHYISQIWAISYQGPADTLERKIRKNNFWKFI